MEIVEGGVAELCSQATDNPGAILQLLPHLVGPLLLFRNGRSHISEEDAAVQLLTQGKASCRGEDEGNIPRTQLGNIH